MNQNNVTLTMSINQLNVILLGLSKLPIETALDTFSVVQKQAQDQLGTPQSNTLSGPLQNKVIQ